MVRRSVLLAQCLPLIAGVLAFAFGLTSTNSKKWSERTFYADDDTYYEHPLYSQYRSPFQICEEVSFRTINKATNVPEVQCVKFSSWGSGKTSCELFSVTKNDTLAQTTTDKRLCQQIHFAGNLSIAGTSFIGIAFFFTLILTAAAVASSTPAGATQTSSADATTSSPSHQKTAEDEIAPQAPPSSAAASKPHHHRSPGHHRILSGPAPYLTATLSTFFILGAILTLLAQFYGVLAFTVSAPDNAKWSISDAGVQDQRDNDHEPWVQGTALTVYASLAWLFALLGALLSRSIWRMPRFAKIL